MKIWSLDDGEMSEISSNPMISYGKVHHLLGNPNIFVQTPKLNYEFCKIYRAALRRRRVLTFTGKLVMKNWHVKKNTTDFTFFDIYDFSVLIHGVHSVHRMMHLF